MTTPNTPPLPRLIDDGLLDATVLAARNSPRRRKNHNFHPSDEFPSHRLLNAIEPDSYIAPHRHLDQNKDETMLVLRGCLGLLVFNDEGEVIQAIALKAGGKTMGVDIPHGCWHTVLALESGTIFLEAKAGPYLALDEAERAHWAPQENEANAQATLAKWQALF